MTGDEADYPSCQNVGIATPFAPALGLTGHKALMGSIVALGLWIFKPREIPFSAAAGLMLAILLMSGGPAATAFTNHTSPAVRILIPAQHFAFALARTGLGLRLAFVILRLVEPSCSRLIPAWISSGIDLSVLTPPITVRMAIAASSAVSGHEVHAHPGHEGMSAA